MLGIRLFAIGLVAAVTVGTARADDSPQRAVVALQVQATDTSNGGKGSLLVREIVRQAILIAARDELGLSTRDENLREPFPERAVQINIATHARPRHVVRFTASHVVDDEEHVLLEAELPLAGTDGVPIIYIDLVERAEAMCRGELAEMLRRAVAVPVERPPAGNAAVPQQVLKNLSEMSCLAQFAALRELHGLIRAEGESPELIGALVHGYANLSQLTRFHWNSAHKTYAARGLLYAERMVAADPHSQFALWHRAYARALVGLHAAALDDLAQAEALGGGGEVPAWLKLVEPFCRYHTGALVDMGLQDPQLTPLAMFLAVITVENCGSISAVVEFAKAGLAANPGCLWLIDLICDRAGVSYLHRATLLGPQVFAIMLPTKVLEMPDLPPRVRAAVRRGARADGARGQVLIARAMIDVADQGEPSWAVLGRMIEEITFAHIQRRAHFMAHRWNVDASDFVAATLPLVRDHPYRGMIESYGKSGDELKEAVRDIAIRDVTYIKEPLIRRTMNTNTPGLVQGNVAWTRMFQHFDYVAPDQEQWLSLMRRAQPASRAFVARELLAVSPEAPLARAMLIDSDWAAVEALAAQWAQMQGDHPAISAALARRYRELNRLEDAERMLRAYTEKAMDQWAYEMLAEIYLEQGDEQRWLNTLEHYLTLEDYGLSHSRVRSNIAIHYMKQGRYEEALPWAEASATSGASWAWETLINCREGLGNLDAAEALVIRRVERYQGLRDDWYFWCVRTGRGDVQAARALAQERFAPAVAAGDNEMLLRMAVMYLIDNQPEEALPLFKRRMEQSPGPVGAIYLVLIAAELGQIEYAEAALAVLEDHMDDTPQARQYAELAQMMFEATRASSAELLNAGRIDQMFADDPGRRAGVFAHVGVLLLALGETEMARPYLEQAVATPPVHLGVQRIPVALAASRLRALDNIAASDLE